MSVLDTPIGEVFSDRVLLDRVVRSIQLDTGASYVDALDVLHEASDAAYEAANGLGARMLDQEQRDAAGSLRGALTHADVDADYVGEAIRLLQRRDEAVTATAQPSKALRNEETDQMGRVLFDAESGPELDADGRLMSRKEFERRLARARQVDPQYAGDEGRKRFELEDGIHLAAGVDLVRTLERPHGEQRAEIKAQAVGRQLDEAIAAAGDKRQKLKQLEAEVAQLNDNAAEVIFDAATAQIGRRAGDTLSDPVKMLDKMESSGLRLLDQDGKKTKKAKKRAKKAGRQQALQMDTDALYAEVHGRLKLLDLPDSAFLKVVEQVLDGEPAPEPEPSAPTIPTGVEPSSYELDQRVRERMRQLDAPESDYPRVLDQILRGEG